MQDSGYKRSKFNKLMLFYHESKSDQMCFKNFFKAVDRLSRSD